MFYKQPNNMALVRRDDKGVDIRHLFSGNYSDDLANIWEFAALSNNAYEKQDETISTTWDRWNEESFSIPKGKAFQINIDGLKTDIFTKITNDETVAAVVYRGTSSLKDWYSNLYWVTKYNPFIRNLYAQARDQIKIIVENLKEEYGNDIKIISTGHSLGGGLAQQAAYTSDAIKLVYAFDPSPATGFSSIPNPERDKNRKNIRIYRIFEHGEFLAYARLLMKASYAIKGAPNADPEVVEIRLNFEDKGTSVTQHGMYKLADKLRKIANGS